LRIFFVCIGVALILGSIATAFVAGGVAWSGSFWPFGGRFSALENLTDRASKLERRFDQFSKTQVLTGLHEVVVKAYPLSFPDSHAQGPFVALSNSEFLVATRLGELHHVVLENESAKSSLVGSLGVSRGIPNPGGVKDLLITAPNVLLASYTTYDEAKGCYALGLFEFSFSIEQRTVKPSRKLFESQPCLPPPLSLEEQAGRIVPYSDGSVLLSVGDMGFHYGGDNGRILEVRLSDGTANVFAMGVRNPQGLFVDDASGLVFETEHGPRGGDEINTIRQGTDYGWPRVTYGTNYTAVDDASVIDTCLTKCGDHTGYELPVFAFVPSIGISNLIRYPEAGGEFHRWRGDLLVGSLRAQTLFRLKYLEGRVIFAEPIHIGERIRDIALLPNGSIALKTDSQQLLVLSRARDSSMKK
jgi:glucose/arabinose dehydrogenase